MVPPVKRGMPSTTARWVAMWRGLADQYPPEMRLSRDPLGLAFAPAWGRLAARMTEWVPGARAVFAHGPLFGLAGWIQLRTRTIDDQVEAFVRAGGQQLVLLGAGYDLRATRLESLTMGVTTFEVDHPATQGHKQDVLAARGVSPEHVRYLAWDFEQSPAAALPRALAEIGHDSSHATLTIWEGVVMYLSESAIKSSLAAISAYSAPGSRLVLNYVDRGRAKAKTPLLMVVRSVGEPYREGLEPAEVAEFLRAEGWRVEGNWSDVELAKRHFPPHLAARFPPRGGWLALAERQPSAIDAELLVPRPS